MQFGQVKHLPAGRQEESRKITALHLTPKFFENQNNFSTSMMSALTG